MRLIDREPSFYTNWFPAKSAVLGCIARDRHDLGGALVLMEETGLYVQVNAGVIQSLDQREVKALLAKKS